MSRDNSSHSAQNAAQRSAEKSANVSQETKERFRQALQAKQAHGGKNVSAEGSHGKVDHSQAAQTSGAQQMFRRKSV